MTGRAPSSVVQCLFCDIAAYTKSLMDVRLTEWIEPGKTMAMPIKYAVRLVVTDLGTGLTVDFVALPGQEPVISAGMDGARVDFFDVNQDAPAGSFAIKPQS